VTVPKQFKFGIERQKELQKDLKTNKKKEGDELDLEVSIHEETEIKTEEESIQLTFSIPKKMLPKKNGKKKNLYGFEWHIKICSSTFKRFHVYRIQFIF
jgi:hypothetical protein